GWSGNSTSSTNSGTRLNTPTANDRPDDRPSRSSPGVTTAGGMAMRIRTFEDGQSFLMAHGVRWQQLAQRDGEREFMCTVPTAPHATTMRPYEARDKYGLVAIQKVIDNISRDQGR